MAVTNPTLIKLLKRLSTLTFEPDVAPVVPPPPVGSITAAAGAIASQKIFGETSFQFPVTFASSGGTISTLPVVNVTLATGQVLAASPNNPLPNPSATITHSYTARVVTGLTGPMNGVASVSLAAAVSDSAGNSLASGASAGSVTLANTNDRLALASLVAANEGALFVGAGQSNLVGTGGILADATLFNADVWDGAGFTPFRQGNAASGTNPNPFLYLAKRFFEQHPTKKAYFVRVGAGGTGFEDTGRWKPGNDLRVQLIDYCSNAKAALIANNITIKTVLFFWVQGEADAKSLAWATAYEANVNSLIADVQAVLGDISVAIVRLNVGAGYSNTTELRTAQEAIAAPAHRWLIDVDDITQVSGEFDGTHYSESGYQKIGDRLYALANSTPTMKLLYQRNENPPPTDNTDLNTYSKQLTWTTTANTAIPTGAGTDWQLIEPAAVNRGSANYVATFKVKLLGSTTADQLKLMKFFPYWKDASNYIVVNARQNSGNVKIQAYVNGVLTGTNKSINTAGQLIENAVNTLTVRVGTLASADRVEVDLNGVNILFRDCPEHVGFKRPGLGADATRCEFSDVVIPTP
jgi:hypothetical protein